MDDILSSVLKEYNYWPRYVELGLLAMQTTISAMDF